MNFLPAKVTAITGNGAGPQVKLAVEGGASLSLPTIPGRLAASDEVLVGVRPEALIPAQDGPIAGKVLLVEHLGGLTLLHVGRHAGDPLIVQCAGNDGTRVGDAIRLTPLAEGCHVFDAKGLRIGADA